MQGKGTLCAALAGLSLAACSTLDPEILRDTSTATEDDAAVTGDGDEQDALARRYASPDELPSWYDSVSDAAREAAGLGPHLRWDADFPYTPGQYSETVPDYPFDAWERVRRGYRMEPVHNDRVQRQIDVFAGASSYFQAVSRRAEPYLYHILEEIEERDLPTELVFVAVVESAFRPFAYSHGRAAGIWQFIPSTGRIFDLEMNWWYDGRRDIIASTDAALTYLERLADSFDGDWLLALASYNAGRGTVSNAMTRARHEGLEPHYWNLRLPGETMVYVPRVLAMREILSDPERYGVSLPEIPNEPYLRTVELERQMDLAMAADLADIDLDRLYVLNPGFNSWATHPDGPHRLVLPVEAADDFEDAVAEMDPDDFVEWRRHRIQPGETLSEIAQQYNITVELLREINQVRGDRIRAGDHLFAPVSSRHPSEYSLSAANRLQSLQTRSREGVRHEHQVQAGETLWDISRDYGVEVRQLARWNGMAPTDTLRPGQTLAVWLQGDEPSRTARHGPGDRTESITYRVRQGDSLYAIARRFNVSIREIRNWNNIPEGAYLQPGQKLQLQVDVTAQSGDT